MKASNTVFSILLFILFPFVSTYSQSCLPDGIIIDDNYDLEDFANNFPNCTVIEGNVTIYSDWVGSISALENIISIEGNLYIDGFSPGLLSGLKSLEHIGGNLSFFNSFGNIFFGLNNLKTIDGDFTYLGSGGQVDFSAFNQVESIGGSLKIDNNSGANSSLTIQMNSLKTIGGSLEILDGNFSNS